MRQLALHSQVGKELAGLPPKQFRQVMIAILDLLDEPFPHYSRPLSGWPFFRIEVGEYRVIYEADDHKIFVLAVGKRNDGEIYRRLKRKA
jgi:mRNA interferase RelE/StbE